uniref:Uncharacterized protein n=1 Tax=Globisporangium ultimum (strain ATCC 200006 / CBS 805.95 / DAOM BR144) TaxID=431595 RepID=K3WCA9_GLOUD
MREERFETQFFSPSKPNAASRKKHKSDPAAVVKKIRGDLGAAVTKAIRRSNRDLTMLHSHGQTLLQSKDTAVQHAGLDNVSELR